MADPIIDLLPAGGMVAVLVPKTPGSSLMVRRRMRNAGLLPAAGVTENPIDLMEATRAHILALLGITQAQLDGFGTSSGAAVTTASVLAALNTTPAEYAAIKALAQAGTGPALTILSVSPSTAGALATAEFRYDRGKPTAISAATLGGAPLSLASSTVDNITSGTGATAQGFGRVTFTQPAAGTRDLVLTSSGTYATSSAAF